MTHPNTTDASAATTAQFPPLTRCTITRRNAEGSGYTPDRIYYWSGIVTGKVEITDSVTHRVTYEDNATFDRKFTRLS